MNATTKRQCRQGFRLLLPLLIFFTCFVGANEGLAAFAQRSPALRTRHRVQAVVPSPAAGVQAATPPVSRLPRVGVVFYTHPFLPWDAPTKINITRAFIAPGQTKLDATDGETIFSLPDSPGFYGYYLSPSAKSLVVMLRTSEDITPMKNSVVNNLMLVWLDTKKTKALTTDDAGYGNVCWSSDETKIAYMSAQGVDRPYIPTDGWYAPFAVYVQDLKTGKRKKLFQESEQSADAGFSTDQGDQGLEWIPEHTRLLYSSDLPNGLFLLNAQGGKPVRLTRNVPDDFSLASNRAYWTETEHNLADIPTSTTLRIAALPSSFLKIIQPASWLGLKWMGTYVFPGHIGELVFSPDGSRLAFLMIPPDVAYNAPINLAVLELKTGKIRLLGTVSHHLLYYRWSHDGRYLLWVYSPVPPGRPRLVAAPVDTVAPQPLAQVNWHAQTPIQAVTLLEFPPDTNYIRWREAR